MLRPLPVVLALALLFLISPPARAPTLNSGPALDFDPLLGPWPAERLLVPAVASRTGPRWPREQVAAIQGLVRQGLDRAHSALTALQSTLRRAALALPADPDIAPPLGSDAVFMQPYFDDLFRPQAAVSLSRGQPMNLAEVFVKLTAIAFVGAIVLVPAGCASASVSLYGHPRAVPTL